MCLSQVTGPAHNLGTVEEVLELLSSSISSVDNQIRSDHTNQMPSTKLVRVSFAKVSGFTNSCVLLSKPPLDQC